MLCLLALLLLSPVCIQSTGPINLALYKPTQQSSDYNHLHPASKAVNGIIDISHDFSHTLLGIPGWWKVDLQIKYSIGKIELYNRYGFYDRLAKVSFYTSNLVSPANFSTSPSNWTLRRYHQEAYGEKGMEEFSSPIEGRHVLVYCEALDGLALEEVMVYEYNYAISGTATSSGTNSGFPPSAAIDGDLSTVSSTTGAAADNLWWKVRLSQRIFLRRAYVYVHEGYCSGGPCANRLSKVSYLKNKAPTDVSPITNGAGGWSLCFYSETALGAEYVVSCGVGVYPLTKEFGIHSGGVEVGLRELKLTGFELPQLSYSIDGRTDEQGAISVQVSFLQWSHLLVGGEPPTQYKVELNGVVHMLPHNTSIERQSILFTKLNSEQNYEWKVTCIIQEVTCPGPQPTFTASTVCKEPEPPKLGTGFPSCRKVTNSGRQRWKCTLTWREPTQKFCPGQVSYILQGTVNKTTVSLSAEFYLDGNQPFKIQLRAKNSDNFLSPEVNVSNRTGVLAPQFGSSTLTVTGRDPECVTLTWQEPEYPGGNITTYHYKCSSGDWLTTTTHIKRVCGYNPYTNITCYLKAEHTLTSTEITASGFTPCAVPTAPRDLSYISTEETNFSQKLWKYSFTWQPPSSPNCYDAITYRYSVPDWITSIDTSSTQATVYFEGAQLFNFSVEAKNMRGYSAVSSKPETTGELAPQFGDRQLQLIAHNSSCVKLTWAAPQYPGGTITHYLVKCQLDEWVQIQQGDSVAFKCGYEPYKEVTCYLMAANSKGNSSQLTDVTRTACAVLPAECSPPPAIKGAAASLTGNATAGQTVFYACTAGFVKVGGDVQLTCQRGDNDGYGWRGTPLICSKGVWEGVGSAFGFLFLAIFLFTGYLIFKWRRATKEKNTHVNENVVGSDGGGRKSQDQETSFNNVYDTVPDAPPTPTPEYEAADMQAVGTDHIYESTQ